MTCNETTHVEYAKAMKKFCQDCGKELKPVVNIVEKLNEFAAGLAKGQFSMDKVYQYIINNYIIVDVDIIKYDGKFYTVADFVKEHPYSQFPEDFSVLTKHIFEQKVKMLEKKKHYERNIPNDISDTSKKFITNIVEIIEKSHFRPSESEKIIECISKNLLKRKSKFNAQNKFVEYLLQYYTNDGNIPHEDNMNSKIDIFGIENINFYFYGGLLCISFNKPDDPSSRLVIRPDTTGYWYMEEHVSREFCSDVGKIREWFDKRPASWIRNKELEEEYLKQYK